MVSKEQIAFFEKLTEERDFEGFDVKVLREQFAQLNKKSGSAWIEAAMARPKRDESKELIVAPPFGQ
jgi:hypothetical protein